MAKTEGSIQTVLYGEWAEWSRGKSRANLPDARFLAGFSTYQWEIAQSLVTMSASVPSYIFEYSKMSEIRPAWQINFEERLEARLTAIEGNVEKLKPVSTHQKITWAIAFAIFVAWLGGTIFVGVVDWSIAERMAALEKGIEGIPDDIKELRTASALMKADIGALSVTVDKDSKSTEKELRNIAMIHMSIDGKIQAVDTKVAAMDKTMATFAAKLDDVSKASDDRTAMAIAAAKQAVADASDEVGTFERVAGVVLTASDVQDVGSSVLKFEVKLAPAAGAGGRIRSVYIDELTAVSKTDAAAAEWIQSKLDRSVYESQVDQSTAVPILRIAIQLAEKEPSEVNEFLKKNSLRGKAIIRLTKK